MRSRAPRDRHVKEIKSPLSFSHLATDGAHLGQELGQWSDEEGETETCVLHVVYFFSNLYPPWDNLKDKDGDEYQPLAVSFERRSSEQRLCFRLELQRPTLQRLHVPPHN